MFVPINHISCVISNPNETTDNLGFFKCITQNRSSICNSNIELLQHLHIPKLPLCWWLLRNVYSTKLIILIPLTSQYQVQTYMASWRPCLQRQKDEKAYILMGQYQMEHQTTVWLDSTQNSRNWWKSSCSKGNQSIKRLQNQARRGDKNGGSIKGKRFHWWVTKKIEPSIVEFKDHTPSMITLHVLQLVDT